MTAASHRACLLFIRPEAVDGVFATGNVGSGSSSFKGMRSSCHRVIIVTRTGRGHAVVGAIPIDESFDRPDSPGGWRYRVRARSVPVPRYKSPVNLDALVGSLDLLPAGRRVSHAVRLPRYLSSRDVQTLDQLGSVAGGTPGPLSGSEAGASSGAIPRTIFARIGWMNEYAGPKPGDERPIGGGAWNDKEIGHEVTNFLEVDGKVYGYFEPGLKSGQLNLRRVGPPSGPDFVDGVTVVFLAPKGGEGNLVVVGWYDSARLYADARRHPLKVPGVKEHWYICETSKGSEHLIAVSERVWPGVTGRGGFGERNFCYLLDETGKPVVRPWMSNILSRIQSHAAPAVEGEPWSRDEVRAIVDTYFQMLRLEATRKRYSKSQIRTGLQERLPGRSSAAIEYKFQNVSAILDENRLPRIDDYEPARNYQSLLAEEVLKHLDQSPPLESPPPDASEEVIPEPDPNTCVEQPPAPWQPADGSPVQPRPRPKSRIDFGEKEERNRKLGLLGERFVVKLERERLRGAGRPDLADRVEHSSEERGDGLGYDVTSFTAEGAVVHIEVKTTRYGPETAFFLSASEIAFADSSKDGYRLARVFHWGGSLGPKVFELSSDQVLRLQREPTHYRCWI